MGRLCSPGPWATHHPINRPTASKPRRSRGTTATTRVARLGQIYPCPIWQHLDTDLLQLGLPDWASFPLPNLATPAAPLPPLVLPDWARFPLPNLATLAAPLPPPGLPDWPRFPPAQSGNPSCSTVTTSVARLGKISPRPIWQP